MKLRCISFDDITQLREIHSKHFKNEFENPNFFDNFLSSFVVTDENNKIITGGGVRTIIEAVIVTDKDVEIQERRMALLEMLKMSAFVGNSNGYKELHAFIQDEDWMRHLKKAGFNETKGRSLVLNI